MRISKKLQITYDVKHRVLDLQYLESQFKIGVPELRGVVYSQLLSLDPDTRKIDHAVLRICEVATEIRLAALALEGEELPPHKTLDPRIQTKQAFTQLNELIQL